MTLDEELEYLKRVEIPNTINRAMQLSYLLIPNYNKEFHDAIGEDIKRISNAEVDLLQREESGIGNIKVPQARKEKRMNELQTFDFKGNGIRTITIEEEPYFVGKDVAEVLGYSNPSKALADHVDDDDKLNNESLSSLGQRGGWLINESGLYSLILSSKLPSAKEFKHWVTSEVLPSIRKTGGYQMPKTFSEALRAYANQIEETERLKIENSDMKPKALFADAVSTSHDSILVGQLAKLIKQNGSNIGQNRLFAWMRENGYLCTKGDNYNMPTQKSMELALFEIKERTVNNPDGSVRITRTPKVTGKGQIYFVNKLCGNDEVYHGATTCNWEGTENHTVVKQIEGTIAFKRLDNEEGD